MNRQDTQAFEDLADLTQRYLMGELSAEQTDQLNQMLMADASAAAAFFQITRQCVAMREAFSSQQELRSRTEESALDFASFQRTEVKPNEPMVTAHALAELARLHDEGAAQPVSIEAQPKSVDRHAQGSSHGTALRARLLMAGGLAAAIALAGVVVLVMSVLSGTPAGESVVNKPEPARVVATLTGADKQASWGGGAGNTRPSVGDALRLGQRLVLEAGLAELTTQAGAVVTIQAPCTVELLDDNALQLHTGRLVGLVETASAKGLLIRTPQLDVTDLGTEFGVQVNQQQVSTTVFNGLVELTGPEIRSTKLFAQQSARHTPGSGTNELVVEDAIIEGFARHIPGAPVVLSVDLGLDGVNAELAPSAFDEFALLYSDRDYRVRTIGHVPMPRALLGGDIVRMPIDAKNQIKDVRLGLSVPADVYLIIPPNARPQAWFERDYQKTPMTISLSGLRMCEVWKRKTPASGTAVVAGPLRTESPGMYTIVVKPAAAEGSD